MENFRQICTKLTMFVFVKSLKGSFQRRFCNDKHINLRLLKDFYPFKSLKSILLLDQRKKRNIVCKNAPIIALDDLWPHFKVYIWTFSYKKHLLNVFQTYNYKQTKFGLKSNMFTYKKIKLFYSSTYFLIFALNDLWPHFWPSYANSDLASTPMVLYTC